METNRPSRSARAFTFIELLFIIALIILVLAALMPRGGGDKVRAQRWQCVNNLKQIGQAFKTWPIDSSDGFPMTRSTNSGGSLEYVATGEVFRHFQVLSNDLVTPKVLICPDDTRLPAKDFTSGLSNANLSYFAGVDARETSPDMFLAGDRNLTNGVMSPNRILVLQTNSAVGWTHELHKRAGNVLLCDGSVQQISNRRLQAALQASGTTNRLAIP